MKFFTRRAADPVTGSDTDRLAELLGDIVTALEGIESELRDLSAAVESGKPEQMAEDIATIRDRIDLSTDHLAQAREDAEHPDR